MKQSMPRWPLSECWGVGTDPYNWVLYRRTKKTWKPVGYYPTAPMLLKDFYEKLCRLEPDNGDLIQHVETLSERLQAAADAFHEAVNGAGRVWPALKELRRAS